MVRSISDLAADQRIDLAGHRLLVEVHAVVRQRVLAAAARLFLALLLRWSLRMRLLGALHRALRRTARRLGDAVADEVDRVEPGHVLQLQEVDRVALPLAEQRDQHVGAGHLVAARGLDMDRGALHHALEPGGRLRIARPVGGQAGEILVEEFGQVTAQLVEIDAACPEHGGGIAVVGQSEQQVFQGGIFVPAFTSEGQARDGASVRGSATAYQRRSFVPKFRFSRAGCPGSGPDRRYRSGVQA